MVHAVTDALQMYMCSPPSGDHSHALVYHQTELSLSEGGGDQLGAAIAHRRIGECHCEMGNYREALSHQNKHLEISKQLGQWSLIVCMYIAVRFFSQTFITRGV